MQTKKYNTSFVLDNVYCTRIEEYYKKLKNIDIARINRKRTVILQVNLKLHTPLKRIQKFGDIGYEILSHLLYSL